MFLVTDTYIGSDHFVAVTDSGMVAFRCKPDQMDVMRGQLLEWVRQLDEVRALLRPDRGSV